MVLFNTCSEVLLNPNNASLVSKMLCTSSSTITGSMFLSLFLLFVILLAICIMFGIPMEFSGVILLPFVLVCMTYYSEFIGTGGIILIYLTFVIAKNLPFR